ncbi:MAG: ABC transporter permease [Mucinivorans sp.]
MKNIFKNLRVTLLRFRLSSLLNIVGLSVALAAFMLITMQVHSEYTAGMDFANHERIFRLQLREKNADKSTINIYKPITERFIQTTPQIKKHAQLLYSRGVVTIDDQLFENVPTTWIHDDISKLFPIRMIEGVFAAALEPNSVVLSQSTARLFFGDSSPMGRTVAMGKPYTVVGVCADFPSNGLLANGTFAKSSNEYFSTVFVELPQGADAQQIAEGFYDANKKYFADYVFGPVKLVAAGDTYFENEEVNNSFVPRGNRTTTAVLLTIALMVIVIAAINFINFATAMAPLRIRSLNTRGIYGCSRLRLRVELVAEAVLFTMLSFLIALMAIYALQGTSLVGLLSIADTSVAGNWVVVVWSSVVALVLGVVAGIYPAIYCTNFEPAMVVNGSYRLSGGSRLLSDLLIGFQFAAATVLIVFSIMVFEQHNYMVNKSLGYKSADVVVVEKLYDSKKMELVRQKLSQEPYVKQMAMYNGAFGLYPADNITRPIHLSDTLMMNGYFCDENFLSLMQIPIIKGRNFTAEDRCYFDPAPNKGDRVCQIGIINRAAADLLQVDVDSLIKFVYEDLRVIGIVDNCICSSLYDLSTPVIFTKSRDISTLAIRVDEGSGSQAIQNIRRIVKSVEEVQVWKVNFYDTLLAALYDKERDLGSVILIFSALAIFISLMGVFGLVTFVAQRRRREIGLRKVYGSTIGEILVMINSRFIWIALGGFVVGAPVAYVGVELWLEGFPYRTPLHWWVFAVALLVVLTITLLTVTVQSYRAATENPVKSIKS